MFKSNKGSDKYSKNDGRYRLEFEGENTNVTTMKSVKPDKKQVSALDPHFLDAYVLSSGSDTEEKPAKSYRKPAKTTHKPPKVPIITEYPTNATEFMSALKRKVYELHASSSKEVDPIEVPCKRICVGTFHFKPGTVLISRGRISFNCPGECST